MCVTNIQQKCAWQCILFLTSRPYHHTSQHAAPCWWQQYVVILTLSASPAHAMTAMPWRHCHSIMDMRESAGKPSRACAAFVHTYTPTYPHPHLEVCLVCERRRRRGPHPTPCAFVGPPLLWQKLLIQGHVQDDALAPFKGLQQQQCHSTILSCAKI
eukprot:1146530-Pelagomonas_calceolata.AAC.1